MMAADDATLDDLLEVRLGLEVNAAMLAAFRATDFDIEAIKRSVDDMEEDLNTTDNITPESDVSFHMSLSFATKNPVLIHLSRSFYDFLFVGIKKNLVHLYMERQTLDQILSQHKEIYKYIEARDPEAAGDAMRRHILYVQEYFKGKYR